METRFLGMEIYDQAIYDHEPLPPGSDLFCHALNLAAIFDHEIRIPLGKCTSADLSLQD